MFGSWEQWARELKAVERPETLCGPRAAAWGVLCVRDPESPTAWSIVALSSSILTQRCFVFFFILERKGKRETNIDVKHQWVASSKSPYQGSNMQSGDVP